MHERHARSAMKMLTGSSSRQHGISEVITTLLLIVLAVAAALVLYAFARGLLPGFTSGGPSSLVTGSGQMTIPGSTGVSAILTVTVRNEGSQPIQSITAICANPPFQNANCTTPSTPPLTLQYQGSAVSASNLLAVNALASGSAGVTAATTFTAGTSYSVILTIRFVGGSTQTVVITVSSTS
jgi:hypothetical protein